MPSTTIETRTHRTPDQEIAMIDAVHRALVEAFRIPAHDRNIRLVEHAPHRFPARPDRPHPAASTIVTIDAFAGRSLDAKRKLYQAIVANLEPLGIPRDHVMIVLREIPRENWGIRGGQAGCDVELGFVVEV